MGKYMSPLRGLRLAEIREHCGVLIHRPLVAPSSDDCSNTENFALARDKERERESLFNPVVREREAKLERKGDHSGDLQLALLAY